MIRLRQVAFATRNLPAGERSMIDTLDVERCYQDPNLIVFGLENALFPVGDQFLEIVTPVRADTTAGRLLDKRGGDCGYMALFQVDDLAPVEARLSERDVRIVYDADAGDIRGLHLHPKDVPGAIVSIDAAQRPAEWPWAGPAWRDHVRTTRSESIAGMTVAVASPDAAARVWGGVLGIEPDESNALHLDDATVRFVESAGGDESGICGLDVVTSERALIGEESHMLGIAVRFVGSM